MKTWLTRHKKLSVFLVALFLYVIATAIYNINLNYEKSVQAAQSAAAEQARIEADPITPEQLYNDMNKRRTDNGLQPFTQNPSLVTSASQKCQEMATANYYAHTNPATGKTGLTFIKDNLKSAGDIAEVLNQINGKTGMEFIDTWLQSPSHKAALLDPKYTDVGFAVCAQNTFPTTVGHLANVKAPAPTVIRQAAPVYSRPSTSFYVPPPYIPPRSINCTSNSLGNTTYTNCY